MSTKQVTTFQERHQSSDTQFHLKKGLSLLKISGLTNHLKLGVVTQMQGQVVNFMSGHIHTILFRLRSRRGAGHTAQHNAVHETSSRQVLWEF